MAFAEDLIEQAHHLACREKTKPRQASLRRAVSTAYYALFHLLIREAVANWKRSDQRLELARAFDHGRMKKASQQVANRKSPGARAQIVAGLRQVASAFAQLQESRHLADYDGSKKWSRTGALKAVNRARAAFAAWQAIRTERIAQDYLFELLFPRR